MALEKGGELTISYLQEIERDLTESGHKTYVFLGVFRVFSRCFLVFSRGFVCVWYLILGVF